MKLHYGRVPETVDFQPDQEGWHEIRGPGQIVMQIVAFPVGVLIFLVIGGLLSLFWPQELTLNKIVSAGAFLLRPLVVIIIFLVPVHELIHALFHPAFGTSDQTIIGLWLRKWLFYAYYQGPMSRNRLLMVYAGPFIVLSLLPLGMLALFKSLLLTTDWAIGLALLSLLGGVIAACDFVGFILIMIQVPSSAIVRSKGWGIYWRTMIAFLY